MTHWERWEQNSPPPLFFFPSASLFSSLHLSVWPCSNQSVCRQFLADCKLCPTVFVWSKMSWKRCDLELCVCVWERSVWKVYDESRGKWLWHVLCSVSSSSDSMLQGNRTNAPWYKGTAQPVSVALRAFSTSLHFFLDIIGEKKSVTQGTDALQHQLDSILPRLSCRCASWSEDVKMLLFFATVTVLFGGLGTSWVVLNFQLLYYDFLIFFSSWVLYI